MKVVDRSFYLQNDVVFLARNLLGKVISTRFNNQLTSGIITETEAYAGITDRASHAFGGRRTARTEVMYAPGGTAYIYLCYGIHHLFNVVTNVEGIPHAVLIRNIIPLEGLDVMMDRRWKTGRQEDWKIGRQDDRKTEKKLLTGPGTMTQALGINLEQNGTDLLTGPIRIEDHNIPVSEKDITITPRIGVDYAGEDAKLMYRFILSKK